MYFNKFLKAVGGVILPTAKKKKYYFLLTQRQVSQWYIFLIAFALVYVKIYQFNAYRKL